MIFARYSFIGSNLRVLVDEIVRDGDKRPRHYIVNPGLRHYEQLYWSERKFHAFDFTFVDFSIELDRVIPTSRRTLGIVAEAIRQTSFTKFISIADRRESSGLRAYMAAECVHVSSELEPNVDTPQRFFRGFDTVWFPYDIQLDVRRRVVDSVLREQILGMEARARTRFVLIKAHAGAGKTIALRRIAWEAGRRFSKLVFYMSKLSLLDLDKMSEIISLTNEKIFPFIDDVADHREALYELCSMDISRACRVTCSIRTCLSPTGGNCW